MSRRDAREKLIQALYQHEFHTEDEAGSIIPDDWLAGLGERDRRFYKQMLEGVAREQHAVDALLSASLQGWSLDRLNAVDRAILRLGVYELCYVEDIPAAVTINEAVELAKLFSTDKSARYINGVLSDVRRTQTNKTGEKAGE